MTALVLLGFLWGWLSWRWLAARRRRINVDLDQGAYDALRRALRERLSENPEGES